MKSQNNEIKYCFHEKPTHVIGVIVIPKTNKTILFDYVIQYLP